MKANSFICQILFCVLVSLTTSQALGLHEKQDQIYDEKKNGMMVPKHHHKISDLEQIGKLRELGSLKKDTGKKFEEIVKKVKSRTKNSFEDIKYVISQEQESQANESTRAHPSDAFEREAVDPLCTKAQHDINNSGDFAYLTRTCAHVSGDIFINEYNDAVLDFGTLSSIGGSLKVANVSNLVRIDAPILTSIRSSFSLNELTSLTSINFSYLKSVDSIEWKILPILSSIGFDAGLDQVKNILISDTSLVGFSLKNKVKDLDSLNLNNNRFLESISADIETITNGLTIAANARNSVISFPFLEKVSSLTIRDVSNIDLPKIKEITGSAKFYENSFQRLKLPNLTSIGGTLSIIQNRNLNEADFGNVNAVDGGLMISNNTNMEKINYFGKLKSIGGGIQFIGNFREASFPKLELVKGSAMIKTTSGALDCSKWTDTDHLIIRGGNIVCASGDKKEVLHYDSNDIKGTLSKSKTIEDSETENENFANIFTSSYGLTFAGLLVLLL